MIWAKLLEEMRRDPDSEISKLVSALDEAIRQFQEQPLEVAFRLMRIDGPSLRVSIEDLGKLIHGYNNLLTVNQSLEHEVVELEERLTIARHNQRMKKITCPHCSSSFDLSARVVVPSSLPPPVAPGTSGVGGGG